jgi:hypothetical protein
MPAILQTNNANQRQALNEEYKVHRHFISFVISTGILAISTAWADQTHIEVAACKLSFQDMLRQPKDKPLVLTEAVMNCGKHGQHSLEAFYGQGWRLIQVVSDEGAGARVAIFERTRQ